MASYGVWVFDLLTVYLTDTRTGRPTRMTATEVMLYEECPPDWTKKQAVERAALLAAKIGSVFIVRTRGASGTWSKVTSADEQRGRAVVAMRESESIAKRAAARRMRKLLQNGDVVYLDGREVGVE